jgi:Nif-specific regulatory protein
MERDRSFLEKVSSIIADSAKLRERILEEQFRLRGEDAEHGTAADTRPLAAARREAGEDREHGGKIAPGSGIVGTSSALRSVYEMLAQVAPSDATVLVTGESGTGKELVAVELHRLSSRAGAPLVKINCAALPESVIESELFGHEKGAFTGAVKERKGRFELADRGTIFLDEVGELSPQVQVKLLRVLQERELERVGGTGTIKVDVRLIAATNRKLEEEVKAGRFREDLYYRLNVFPLRVPPLRERKSDIILLADYFAEKYAEKNGKLIKRISTPALDLLASYSWPGNVRELENCIERAVILSADGVIHSYDLPPSLQSAVSTNTEPITTLEAALSRLEKELIVEALKITDGNMAAAARRLGISERRIGLRVHHYGINWRLYRSTKM